jgi:hypothetical protein
VVVRDFDIVGITVLPAKADAVLLIDSDTMLAGPIPLEAFEAVTWRYSQLAQVSNPIHLVELAARNGPESPRTCLSGGLGIPAVEDVRCPAIGKRPYHGLHYNGDRIPWQAMGPASGAAIKTQALG